MFVSRSTPAVGSNAGAELRGTKRQYTVKGIDVDTVDMMRDAAKADGMKISAWISSRMRDAAKRSLNSEHDVAPVAKVITDEADTGNSFRDLVDALADFRAHQASTEEKLEKIEAELHLITSSQRTILTKMLERLVE